jgi:hypothetical protein
MIHRLQSAVIQQNFREVGVELDVRCEFATLYADVLKETSALRAAMDRRVRPTRHHSPGVSLAADAAVGRNRGYFNDPHVDGIERATVSEDRAEVAVVQRRAEDGHRRPLHQPLEQDQFVVPSGR